MPIDHYSYDAVDLLIDTVARWQTMRGTRDSAAFTGDKDPTLAQPVTAPGIDIYAIDVSFPALRDKTEFEYLNNLPTAFVLPREAVERLRAAAATVVLSSPEFQPPLGTTAQKSLRVHRLPEVRRQFTKAAAH